MRNATLEFEPCTDFMRQALDIVRGEFEQGLRECCSPTSLQRHYEGFLDERDPIMFPLVQGMKDKGLERTLVSYYDIYQTLATRSRFWLFAALVKIILLQERFGRPITHVFTRKSLANGHLDWEQTISSMGDEANEILIGGSGNKKWTVSLDRSAFDEIQNLGKEYFKEYDRAALYCPYRRPDVAVTESLMARDRRDFETVVTALGRACDKGVSQPMEEPVPIECDLLVVGPQNPLDRLSIVAIRLVNPKTFKDREKIIGYRTNLLLLKAFLAQQKPERSIDSIQVWVCEIVDRNIDRGYPFFSPLSYRNNTEFWDDYIKVPFSMVRKAIEEVGQESLARNLRALLP